jgi:hypothetical protein
MYNHRSVGEQEGITGAETQWICDGDPVLFQGAAPDIGAGGENRRCMSGNISGCCRKYCLVGCDNGGGAAPMTSDCP